MKNLIFINGTMGVGKTETSKKLLKKLPDCVFLDGDWCWYADPWIVNDETKSMAEQNMTYLLNNFLRCSAYENVIFCWVMHTESLIKRVQSWIKGSDHNLYKFSLICCENILKTRLKKDIKAGLRENSILDRALERCPNYLEMSTTKIDVSDITPEQAADIIYNFVYPEK